MILGMITGAIIASVFFIAGYYVAYRRKPETTTQSYTTQINETGLKSLVNDKGFYSYKKYSGR